jgi:hypothetical protein
MYFFTKIYLKNNRNQTSFIVQPVDLLAFFTFPAETVFLRHQTKCYKHNNLREKHTKTSVSNKG